MITFSEEDLILITGASSGIGRSTALLCNELGAKVIAVARSVEQLNSLKEEAVFPENIIVEPHDLAVDLETLPNWVTDLRKQYGKFAGFVHCAGHNIMVPIKNYDLKESERVFSVHYHSAMLITKAMSDRRNCAKQCSLVYVSSVSAVFPYKTLTSYASAKACLITSAKSISKELGAQNIRVNCVSPALVRTPLTEEYAETVGYDVFEAEKPLYPLGICEAKDIAEPIIFLLSEKSRKITGQNFVIDGGRF